MILIYQPQEHLLFSVQSFPIQILLLVDILQESIFCKCNENEIIRNTNLKLLNAIKIVLEEGLRLIDINPLERM